MQIDPIYLLQPAAAFALSLGVLVYWWNRSGFRGIVFLLSFGAYWLAIALKEVVQYISYGKVVAAFGYVSIGTALYFGLQTVFFEVGLAYLLARYGVRSRGVATKDAPAYGIGLSFWENGILLGILALFNLAAVYLILSTGSSLAATVASQLPSAYFASGTVALQNVALGTLERISSMMIHIAWGVLCVLSAATGKKRFLAVALPMGLVDAAVPFAGQVSIEVFEAILFLVSLTFVGVAWLALRSADSERSEKRQYAES